MLEKISDALQHPLLMESLSSRGERMLPAAMYGGLVATAHTLAFTLVNVYSFPNLPLALDWPRFLVSWLGFGAALALAGLVVGWFTEDHDAIITGAGIFTALLALGFLIQLGAKNSLLTIQSVLMALPLIGVNMLAAAALRWLARRHNEVVRDTSTGTRRKRLAAQILIVFAIGAAVGLLGRMDLPSENSLASFHKFLKAALNDPSARAHLPLKQVPALQDHFGIPYVFYAHQSESLVGNMDVTVRFSDGFTMMCLVPNGGISFFSNCQEDK